MRSKHSICCKSSVTRGRLAFFLFFSQLFSDWLIFCFGSLLCRFVGTLGFFSCDVVYNVSDIFGFWF